MAIPREYFSDGEYSILITLTHQKNNEMREITGFDNLKLAQRAFEQVQANLNQNHPNCDKSVILLTKHIYE